MCESKVHAWVKPRASALCASSTTRQAGGSVWKVTPKSMRPLFLFLLTVPPLAELRASAAGVELRHQDTVEFDRGSGWQPQETRAPVGYALFLRGCEDLVGEVNVDLGARHVRPVGQDLLVAPHRLVEGGLVVGSVLGEEPCSGLRVPRLPGPAVGVEPFSECVPVPKHAAPR